MKKLSLILAALGLFVFIYIGYTYLANGDEHAHQAALVERYEAATAPSAIEPDKCVPPKDVSGVLRIPALDLVQPIVDSIHPDVLDSGVVGAYPGRPGKGNYSLAGHRVTHGEPFRNLPNLGNGDKITIEWGCKTFTYEVVGNFEVPMSDTSVLESKDYPTLTLITCASLFETDERTIVVAKQV